MASRSPGFVNAHSADSLTRSQGVSCGHEIVVGLVNCMPEAARRATERQFRDLLAAASPSRHIELRSLTLPDGVIGRFDETWEDASDLDGVIVTGAEPRAPTLPQEPCWTGMTRIADWAGVTGVPVIWSCLAAHVAALHLGGVSRQRQPWKLSGVFDCMPAMADPILRGLPTCWRVPHSRWNGLDEDALAACGCRVLSRSPKAGVDIFAGPARTLSLFLQGHPEYDPQTLLLEYRRDIGRFLSGERELYPALPSNYFDQGAARVLAAFRRSALRTRRPEQLGEFPIPEALRGLRHCWRDPAVRLYANWVRYLAERTPTRRRRMAHRPERSRAELSLSVSQR